MQEHRTLDETRRMIIEVLEIAEQPLTRSGIAKALHRKKTPHLIEIIDTLVEEGVIIQGVKTFHNGVQGYIYRMTDAS